MKLQNEGYIQKWRHKTWNQKNISFDNVALIVFNNYINDNYFIKINLIIPRLHQEEINSHYRRNQFKINLINLSYSKS